MAAVVGSAVVPTLIANAFFLPRHLVARIATEGHVARKAAVAIEGGTK